MLDDDLGFGVGSGVEIDAVGPDGTIGSVSGLFFCRFTLENVEL